MLISEQNLPEIELEPYKASISPDKFNRAENSVLSPEKIGRSPYRYQEKVIDWSKGRDKIPLFIEMRLGKTLITINWLKNLMELGKVRRTLIVCPLTVLPVWQKELSLEGLTALPFNTKLVKTPLAAAVAKLPGIFTTNYECITRTDISDPEKYQWDCVILDETTKIRYPDTQITKENSSRLYFCTL
jgi:SNF2 family DNA or RNA helicase